MAQYERTITVKLSPEEASKIIREALQLPTTANVRFVIGVVSSDPMGRYDSNGVTSVECTYKEGATTAPGQFGNHGNWHDR